MLVELNRVDATLSRADPNNGIDWDCPDLAITDAAGLCGSNNGVNDCIHVNIINDDLKAHLGN
jgi:hypothetical protein